MGRSAAKWGMSSPISFSSWDNRKENAKVSLKKHPENNSLWLLVAGSRQKMLINHFIKCQQDNTDFPYLMPLSWALSSWRAVLGLLLLVLPTHPGCDSEFPLSTHTQPKTLPNQGLARLFLRWPSAPLKGASGHPIVALSLGETLGRSSSHHLQQ